MSGKVVPKTLPGFMQLLPKEQILFNEMKEKIKNTYEKYGFLPLNTPIIESSEVLLAKAGGETEKQIYRFNKGESDLSLRFDLTVPLAKYVTENYANLTFPFRRYQIGKVYRGEKAQRGRFREFYQCDIDILGEGELSLINDAEIPSVIYTVFKELGFTDFTISINNRKILNGLFEALELKNNSADILRIIDKIEKIGKDNVISELEKLGVSSDKINVIMDFISITGDVPEVISNLKNMQIENELFLLGIEELEFVAENINLFGVPKENYKIDLTIARGLDYYTGTVYETFLNEYKSLGSVCSGGRYDNLAEYYTDKKLPGVGISIGLTRLFFQLNDKKIINSDDKHITKVLIISMIDDFSKSIEIATQLRQNGINTQVYTDKIKVKNQFKYANKLNIPYVIILGEDEVKENKIALKSMQNGDQVITTIDEAIDYLKNN
ncbi:MAG: histidine--tRNA ligase [Clostridiales bacterium]|nr:histidine--tRNA ligase [Clostridiales bacterium]